MAGNRKEQTMGRLIKGLLRRIGIGEAGVGVPSGDDVEHYLHLREASGNVYGNIIDMLPARASREVARALDLPDAESFIVRPEGMIDPVMDCCVHCWTEDGGNMVRRFAEDGPRLRDPDARELLEAMLHARFMLLRIEECVPKIGARATDLVTGEELFILDVSLSLSRDAEESVIVGQALPIGDHWMLTGGGDVLSGEEARRLLEDFDREGKALTPESIQAPETVYAVFRWCLQESDDVILAIHDIGAIMARAREFVEQIIDQPEEERLPLLIAPRGPSRNAICPCGSGRRYKRCCGKEGRVRRSA